MSHFATHSCAPISCAADVADVLSSFNDDGRATAKQLAEWTGRSLRTCYGWYAGEQWQTTRDLALIAVKLPAECRLRLASGVLRGWGVAVSVCAAVLKFEDLAGEGLDVSGAAQDLNERIHQAGRDGHVDAHEQREIRDAALAVEKEAADVAAAVNGNGPHPHPLPQRQCSGGRR